MDMKRVVILGAAGRDFHNFNTVFRDDRTSRVVAFTAAQIPDIAGRLYPASLAGPLYPDGIPIVAEEDLAALCAEEGIDEAVFAYSDVAHETVMHLASVALAGGADFRLLGPDRTMLTAAVPVIAVSAVRTGCGKSQTTRWLAERLKRRGLKVAVLRHPMPYGDLARQAVQRFASLADIAAADCTVEEREEYEPHVAAGNLVYAGVDYAAILARAEAEAGIILWDGGNNDFPFLRPDLHIVLVDPFRPGDESRFHPGETTLRMADIVVVAKANSAPPENVALVEANVRRMVPGARIVRARSDIRLPDPAAVRGRRVLAIEDGPTVTHGGMAFGAGYVAALQAGAGEIVDPRRAGLAELDAVYARYPHLGPVLPALGYGAAQLDLLARAIAAVDCDLVLSATPCDLAALIPIAKPVQRVGYAFAEADDPGLGDLVDDFLDGL